MPLLWTAARKILAALSDTPRPPDPDTLVPGTELTASAAPAIPLPDLADAVTRALTHLADAGHPRDAVVAAWVALEDAAAQHGTARRARFTTRPTDQHDVTAARTALVQIARSLDTHPDTP
ncbi:hypothetical protein UQW22_14795 [Isoptericola halotolerans]|uniref:hypothetical protein n=1 Tax=Isoptericola halotolerans TaxID=300560 RepID=UPI00388E8D9E